MFLSESWDVPEVDGRMDGWTDSMTQRPTSVMIYDLKHFPERHGLMSHLLQHNVYFVNDGSM